MPVVLPARGVARGFRQRSCQRPAVARRRQTAVVAMAAGSSDAGGLFRDQKKVHNRIPGPLSIKSCNHMQVLLANYCHAHANLETRRMLHAERSSRLCRGRRTSSPTLRECGEGELSERCCEVLRSLPRTC